MNQNHIRPTAFIESIHISNLIEIRWADTTSPLYIHFIKFSQRTEKVS